MLLHVMYHMTVTTVNATNITINMSSSHQIELTDKQLVLLQSCLLHDSLRTVSLQVNQVNLRIS